MSSKLNIQTVKPSASESLIWLHACGLITKSTRKDLAGCSEWLSVGSCQNSIFPYETTTITAKKQDNHLYSFHRCLATCRMRADLILLKTKPRGSPQEAKNLSAGCPCLRSPFLWGQVSVLEFSNKRCGNHSYERSLGVLRRFWSSLLVSGWLCVLEQLRSAELFTSPKSNLLELTTITRAGCICQYTQSKPHILVPVPCFWLLQCDGV